MVGDRFIERMKDVLDSADRMRWPAGEAYGGASVVRVVLDKLNTHNIGPLLRPCGPEEAQRLEFHHKPGRGSWLNVTEVELSVFGKQCLRRRIGDEATLGREVSATERERNQADATMNWRFT